MRILVPATILLLFGIISPPLSAGESIQIADKKSLEELIAKSENISFKVKLIDGRTLKGTLQLCGEGFQVVSKEHVSLTKGNRIVETDCFDFEQISKLEVQRKGIPGEGGMVILNILIGLVVFGQMFMG